MKLKIVTYNVDGLPETLDLNDLPWIFKPCVWVYKWIKKTTLIHLNDNNNKAEKTKELSKYIKDQDFDIVGIQEDFNYHKELTSSLHDRGFGTFMGALDLSKIFSMVKWFRYKSDGLGIILKDNIHILEEDIIEWEDSHGYFSYCNDKLTRKGFRRYLLYLKYLDVGIFPSVYVLHADASEHEDDMEDLIVRRKQFTQLTKYITEKDSFKYPIIIMGDTNCSSSDLNKEVIEDYLIKPLKNLPQVLEVSQALPNDGLDRIFVINTKEAFYRLKISNAEYGIRYLSDHQPFIAEMELIPLY